MERELKELLHNVDADAGEMARYRRNLAAQLAPKPSRFGMRSGGLLLAAAACLAVFLLWPRPNALVGRALDELQAMAAQTDHPQQLLKVARTAVGKDKPVAHFNGLMMLCLLAGGDEAMQAATDGLMSDPRPSFRAAYLEYMLDNADLYRFNPEQIERYMEEENDPLCVSLLKKLLYLERGSLSNT